MTDQSQEQDLPQRPRSAFAARIDKNGRELVGATEPSFQANRWSPEAREAQRQKAKAQIAAGTFGAANGFHRRRTKKYQEIMAEHAQEKADVHISKLDAMIDQPKDKRLQLEAIREYMRAEDWATKNAREDEKEFRAMTNSQLESRLLEMLGEAMGLDLSALIGDADVVEAEAVEVPQLVPAAAPQYDPMDRELGGDRLNAGQWEEDDGDEE